MIRTFLAVIVFLWAVDALGETRCEVIAGMTESIVEAKQAGISLNSILVLMDDMKNISSSDRVVLEKYVRKVYATDLDGVSPAVVKVILLDKCNGG